MKINLNCAWADSSATADKDIDVNSLNDLYKELEDFFEDACGMTAVELFGIVLEDDEDSLEFQWDNYELSRSKDLSDVWNNKVKKDIKKFFSKKFKKT